MPTESVASLGRESEPRTENTMPTGPHGLRAGVGFVRTRQEMESRSGGGLFPRMWRTVLLSVSGVDESRQQEGN